MLNKYPLIKILIPFIVGILLLDNYPLTINPFIIGLLGLFLIIVLGIFWFKFSYKNKIYRGIGYIFAIFLIGYSYSNFYKNSLFNLPENAKTDTLNYIAIINEPPTIKEKSVKLNCKIIEFENEKWTKVNDEKCIIYISKDSISEQLKYGDKILFHTQLKEISSPQNPNEFNYKKFLEAKGVRFQSYIEKQRWKQIDSNCGNIVLAFAYKIRNEFLEIFKKYDIADTEYGVLAAILLGYDEKLDPELSKHYSGAGVTHVLCVSGMHVGVIYMILNFFLKVLDKNRKTKYLKSFILLLFIWIYASITGLSPSVQRAATMFTFVALGNNLKFKTDTYSSLLASLMFLIITNPFIILNLGLQLSYLAVFGIVWLQKPIANLWIPKYKVTNWGWQLISVSIAAQIITTPISIFYFHQFPNYFILSNLFVVIVSSFVIYSGVAVLITSFWFELSNLLSQVMIILIKIMNYITQFVNDMPGSKTQNIDIDIIGMLLIYFAIFSILISLIYKLKKNVYVAIISIIIFLCYNVFDNYSEFKTNNITIYSIRNQTIIDIKEGNNLIVICDSNSFKNESYNNFQTNTNRIRNGIVPNNIYSLKESKEINNYNFFKHNNFFKIFDKTFLVINKPLNKDNFALDIDYLVVTNNVKTKIADIYKMFSPKLIIFDNSNSKYRMEKWEKECQKINQKYYFLNKNGAYIQRF